MSVYISWYRLDAFDVHLIWLPLECYVVVCIGDTICFFRDSFYQVPYNYHWTFCSFHLDAQCGSKYWKSIVVLVWKISGYQFSIYCIFSVHFLLFHKWKDIESFYQNEKFIDQKLFFFFFFNKWKLPFQFIFVAIFLEMKSTDEMNSPNWNYIFTTLTIDTSIKDVKKQKFRKR